MKKSIKKYAFGLTILIVASLLGFLQPVKAGGYVDGIDVSHWQGSINWNKVYNAGYSFAFCKASEGISYKDDTFTTNMVQGKSAGLFLGPYHYAHPESNTYTAEAAYFLSVIKSYMIDGYLRPVLDLEVGHTLGKTALTNWVINFINYVKDHTGVEPIIYCNSWYASTYLDSRVTQYDLWIAHWNVESPNTGVWDTWSFWQYKVSSAGYVPGVSGQCDLNRFNGGTSDLRENFVIGSSSNERVKYNGHEYQLFTTEKNWVNAKADCEAKGGHLVTITSKGENDFINNLVGSNKIWIGFTDEATEGIWRWVTGESVAYTNWLSGEPNNYGSGEDYAEMDVDGKWNDIGPPQFPSITRYYVCEWGDKVEYNGHEYQLFTTEKNWADAKTNCEAKGGHLVTITSKGENDFINNLVGSNKVWIGLTDEVTEGTWRWVTSESVAYTNWCPGEPNNYGSGEDYVEMYIDGSWNDNGPPQFPSTTRYYVCEWEKGDSYNVFSAEGAVGYAKYWWNKNNPHYIYYDHADCANFVSQCLIAGGLTLWKGSNGNRGGLDGRGCLPNCYDLHLHLKNYQSISYQRCVKSGSWDNELPLWVTPGTVLTYGKTGVGEWQHTVIVTGGNGNDATVTAHTNDRYDLSWTDYSDFDIIHVYKPNGYTSYYNVVDITATNLNVRTGPSTNYNILTMIQSGEKYVSIETVNGWYRIWLDDRSAWVSGDYLNKYDLSDFNCHKVSVNILTVRDGPSTSYQIVGRCNYGQWFVQCAISGNWIQIYYSSEKYWFRPSKLSEPPETEITNGPSGTIDYNDIEFTWTGSDDTTPPSELTYSYKLEGYDASWSLWASKTNKEYNDLPNGDYTFKVKAMDKDGNIEQTAAERTFTIQLSLNWGIDEYLVRLIDRYAPRYYNDSWDVSISQYKSWIALITLREAGFGRYAAHSQFGRSETEGGTVYCDRFNHKDMGYNFPFSTGLGAFQLDNGGSQGNANENWGVLPTIIKLNPVASLFSALRWHRDRFIWDKANLADFSLYSAWCAVYPSKESGFSGDWKKITGYDWDECKTRKIDVNFNPPTIDDPYSNNVKYIGKVYWDVNNFVGYYNTWLINSRSWSGNIITQYYYTYREDLGYEIWVYKDPEQKYIYRFDRNYAEGHWPEDAIDKETYFIAGTTSDKPSLDPNNIIKIPWYGGIQTGDILLKNNGNILDVALEWTDLGMYVGNDKVIEVKSEGVVYSDLSEWDDDKNVALLRVISAREDQKQSAAKWAESQVGKINSYLWSEKRTDPDSLSWYCSELIWAAYKNQGIDIDFDQSKKFVSPDDIYKDNDIMEISGSQEDLPLLEDYLYIKSKDSVDFNIIDPIGSKVNKEICQITGAYYLEGDIDENSDMEAIVLIPKRKIGDYVISIVPKSNALPTDTYSLEVSTEDETIVLVQDELIKNIPYTPYKIHSDSSGVSYKNSQENLLIFQMYMLIIALVSILGVVSLVIIFREKKIKNR